MICVQCGKEMKDGTKFCPHCGAVNTAAAPSEPPAGGAAQPGPEYAPQYTAASSTQPTYNYGTTVPGADLSDGAAPAGGGKRRGKGLLIGGGLVAVAAIVAVIVVFVSGLFSSPHDQVKNALNKTMSAYSDAHSSLGLSDLNKVITENKAYSQRIRLELNSVNGALLGGVDLSSLNGLGLYFYGGLDQPGRKLHYDLGAFWGDDPILSLQMLADDANFYLTSPEFTGNKVYGLNTETLGADLKRLGAEDDELDLDQLGFNFFGLVEALMPADGQNTDMEQALKDAGKQLMDAMKVEKGGTETIQVNGSSVKATVYHAVISEDALKDYVDAWKDSMNMMDVKEMTRSIFQAMGMPQDLIDESMAEMTSVDFYGEIANSLKDIVKELGDVELDLYISDGYLSKAHYEKKINRSDVEIALYLGGGDQYVDDLSLELTIDGETLSLESSGDHSAKSGTYTDETTIRLPGGNGRLTSEMSYNPKAAIDNLQWELTFNNIATLEMKGQLTSGKDFMQLQLDDVSILASGMEVCSLGLEYYIGPFEGSDMNTSGAGMLSGMDEAALEALYNEVEDNAQRWINSMQGLLFNKLPLELLLALSYMF